MALVPCKQCSAEISDKAKVCPKCGQEDPIAKKLKCSECENMVVPSTEGACPICGNPEVLVEKPPTAEIISNNVIKNLEKQEKQLKIQVVSEKMKNCPFCDKEIQITDKVCQYCSASLDPRFTFPLLLGIPLLAIIVMWFWIQLANDYLINYTGVFIFWTVLITIIWVGKTISTDIKILSFLHNDETLGYNKVYKKFPSGTAIFFALTFWLIVVGGVVSYYSRVPFFMFMFGTLPYIFYINKRNSIRYSYDERIPLIALVLFLLTFYGLVNSVLNKEIEYKNEIKNQQKSLEKK